jgi:hypothetical protein
VVVYGIDHQWQADLVDLAKLSSYNKGFKYFLTCIDVLSRYAWVVKTLNDTGFGLLVVSGKEVHVVFLEKLLKYSVDLMTCIDVLSRYAWVVPLKDKTGKTLKDAFQVIFKSGRRPVTSAGGRPMVL